MTRFQQCFDIVLGNEGGYSDHPHDRGGRTNFGVTQETYSDFLAEEGRPDDDVRNITLDDALQIYHKYWRAAKCDYLPEPLDCAVFDCAINSGAKRATKLLQRVLGIYEDGVCGRDTLEALHEDVVARGVDEVLDDYLLERERFYYAIVRNDASQEVFLRGWLNRIQHLREVLV